MLRHSWLAVSAPALLLPSGHTAAAGGRNQYLANVLVLAVFLSISTVTQAQRLYKYTDSNGQIFYSDRIPAEESKRGREELNSQGVTVKTVEKAKTAEQLAKEAQLAALRSEQRRLKERFLAERRAKDRVLLRTFNSEEELIGRRDSRIDAIEIIVQITQGNINQLQKQYLDLQKSAAEMELSGRPLPKKTVVEMTNILGQIADNEAYIESQRREQEEIRRKFADDLTRFRAIREERRQLELEVSRENKEDDSDLERVVSVVDCRDAEECSKAWALAQLYVRERATTRFQLITDTIIMTAPARKPDDVSITISKIPGSGASAQLFLDVECEKSPEGQAFCSDSAVISARGDFKEYVESRIR